MSARARVGGWVLRSMSAVGLVALAAGGGDGAVVATLGAVGLAAPAPPLPGWAWVPIHAVILAVVGALALVGLNIAAFALLSVWLLVFTSWTARTPDAGRTVLLLSTLVLLLASVRTQNVALAPLFLAYTALLPIALLRLAMHDAGAPAWRLEASLSAATVVSALVLFMALPRLQGGYTGTGGGRVGMPDELALGGDGLGNDDLAEVMRVRVTDPDGREVGGPFYLRGRALDSFDGTRWTSTLPPGPPPPEAWNRRAEIELEALSSVVLFGVGDVRRVIGVSSAHREGNGTFLHRSPNVPLRYQALGYAGTLERVVATSSPKYTALPELDPRVVSFAWSIGTDLQDPAAVAGALRDALTERFAYQEAPPEPVGDATAWFLFDHRAGHCEYFASVLTVLLRAREIPARVATGFRSGEVGDDGHVVVRRGHAHAWVEVPTADGWVVVDATPADGLPAPGRNAFEARVASLVAAWYRAVVDYDVQSQFAAFGAIGRAVLGEQAATGAGAFRQGIVGLFAAGGGLFVALAVSRAALFFAAGNGRARPTDLGARLVAQARRLARRRGWLIPDELPALAAAEWLIARAGPAAAPFDALAREVYAVRYGGAPLDAARLRAHARALSALPRAARSGVSHGAGR